MMNGIRINAPAKINLGLDVIRRRDDGYHELKMIMQTIRLYDRITIKRTKGRGVTLDTNLDFLPKNENNLAFKAAKLLMSEFNIKNKILIQLEKTIPIAAGLAGGSSDAAATLMAINQLFGLGLNEEQLMERGALLGADIPFCIMRGTALSEGIGEILTPLPPIPDCHILIVKPSTHVSTKYVYENLVINSETKHPDIDGILADIKDKRLVSMAGKLENVLETVTIPKHPQIAAIKERLLNLGATGSLMSGSGPTVFGIFLDYEKAEKAFQLYRTHHSDHFVYLTSPYLAKRDWRPIT